MLFIQIFFFYLINNIVVHLSTDTIREVLEKEWFFIYLGQRGVRPTTFGCGQYCQAQPKAKAELG